MNEYELRERLEGLEAKAEQLTAKLELIISMVENAESRLLAVTEKLDYVVFRLKPPPPRNSKYVNNNRHLHAVGDTCPPPPQRRIRQVARPIKPS